MLEMRWIRDLEWAECWLSVEEVRRERIVLGMYLMEKVRNPIPKDEGNGSSSGVDDPGIVRGSSTDLGLGRIRVPRVETKVSEVSDRG